MIHTVAMRRREFLTASLALPLLKGLDLKSSKNLPTQNDFFRITTQRAREEALIRRVTPDHIEERNPALWLRDIYHGLHHYTPAQFQGMAKLNSDPHIGEIFWLEARERSETLNSNHIKELLVQAGYLDKPGATLKNTDLEVLDHVINNVARSVQWDIRNELPDNGINPTVLKLTEKRLDQFVQCFNSNVTDKMILDEVHMYFSEDCQRGMLSTIIKERDFYRRVRV